MPASVCVCGVTPSRLLCCLQEYDAAAMRCLESCDYDIAQARLRLHAVLGGGKGAGGRACMPAWDGALPCRCVWCVACRLVRAEVTVIDFMNRLHAVSRSRLSGPSSIVTSPTATEGYPELQCVGRVRVAHSAVACPACA